MKSKETTPPPGLAEYMTADDVAAHFGVNRSRVFVWGKHGRSAGNGGVRVKLGFVMTPCGKRWTREILADFVRRLTIAAGGNVTEQIDAGAPSGRDARSTGAGDGSAKAMPVARRGFTRMKAVGEGGRSVLDSPVHR